jgi:O-antigen ligase
LSFLDFKAPLSGRFVLESAGMPVAVMVALLLLLLSWLQPLHFLPWVSWHSEVPAFLAVLALGWQGIYAAARNKLAGTIAFPITAIPLLALALWVWLQEFAGLIMFGGDAFVLSVYLIVCTASMVLGYASSHKPGVYHWLAITLLLGAFLSTIVALVQTFELWEGFAWINRMPLLRRPGGNLGQPNQLASLLVMGLASLLFLFESRKIGAAATALMALTLFAGLAATESRAGALSFLLLAAWWFAKRKPMDARLPPWVVACATIGFLVLFWAWPRLMDFVLPGAGSEVPAKAFLRWVVWPQLIEALLQRPWSGWGLGQVSTAHNAVVHAYPFSEPYTFAHNLVLDLALGVGIPLAGLLVLVTGVWLWRRLRSASQLVPWYCLAVVLPVAVHSMLEFPFAYAYFLAPVMFAIGALEGALGAKPAFSLGVKPVAAMLFAATAVMAWSAVEYLSIEEDFRIVRFEALQVGTTPVSYQRPHVVLLTQLDALLHGGRIVPKPGMNTDEMALSRKVALRFPWPATQNRYALALALNGNPDEAVRQLKVLRALHGEKTYGKVKDTWGNLANEKYPQLRDLRLP